MNFLSNHHLFELEVDELVAELERLEQEKKEKENRILTHIKKGNRLFFSDQYKYREGILHPCTKDSYLYQFTYFDQLGPIGDFCRNSLEEIAKGIVEYGYQPLETDKRKYL